MNHNRKLYLQTVLAISVMLVAATACQDDPLYDRNVTQFETDLVMFDAVIGTSSSATRSAENPTDLPPIVMEGGDFPLYLHRYVCDNSYDPAEVNIVQDTRGVQINDMAKLTEEYENFYVKALYTDSNDVYFNSTSATEISNSDGKWLPSDSKKIYWPGDDSSLTFYAWAPGTISTDAASEDGVSNFEAGKQVATGNEQISFNYTAVKDKDGIRDAVVQKDLLLAINSCNKSSSTGGVAKLTFQHPLSAIKFSVRDVMDCTVTGISIENVYKSGKCTYTLEDGAVWTNYKTDANKGIFSQSFDVEVSSESEKDDNGNIPITDTDDDNATTFMMIPQEIPDDAMIAIKIKFNLKDKDGNDVKDENNQVIVKELTLKSKIKDFENDNNKKFTEWLPGKEYVYVISTSASNWTYVFDVLGSYQKDYIKFIPVGNPFAEPDANNPADLKTYPIEGERRDVLEVNHTADENGYYKVRSYRYRTNNPADRNIVPWSVSYSEGTNEIPIEFQDYAANIDSVGVLQPGDWIIKTTPALISGDESAQQAPTRVDGDGIQKITGEGPGSFDYSQYYLSFHPQYVATDYGGDWWLRRNDRVLNNTRETAVDLSRTYDKDGKRNTANCYLVNAGGWYKLPLVYGNAITNGVTNESSYTFKGSDIPKHVYKDFGEDGSHNTWKIQRYGPFAALNNFVDHDNQKIEGPWITRKYTPKDAILVWEDARGIIKNVQLTAGDVEEGPNSYLSFYVDNTNLIQSNAIVAVRDASGTILWSWHIWVTDYCHWAIDSADKSPMGRGSTPDMPEDEAVTCDEWKGDENLFPDKTFDIAPVNLGWCDRKNVGFLQRTGVFRFTQLSDRYEEHPAKQAEQTLSVKQRGQTVNFWVGNNPYYQFGRKDPSVGGINAMGRDKPTYGDIPFSYHFPEEDIPFGIKNPDKSYRRPSGILDTYNLWNNYYDPHHYKKIHEIEEVETGGKEIESTFEKDDNAYHPRLSEKYTYSAIKTVYDPSPPGFIVPPYKLFDVFTKGRNWPETHRQGVTVNHFNGECVLMTNPDNYNGSNLYFTFKGKTKRDCTGPSKIYFRPTGHREGWFTYSSQLVYLSSNILVLSFNAHYSMVLGVENLRNDFLITSAWRSSCSCSDAIRCVREFTNPPEDQSPDDSEDSN